MLSVIAGGSGLVAVGSDKFSGGGNEDAAIWLSKDGRSWTRVPRDEKVFGGKSVQNIQSVTGGGRGLVAVGVDNHDAAVWLSPPDSD